MKRVVAFLFLLILISTTAYAAERSDIPLPNYGSSVRQPVFRQIVEKMKNVNSGLKDYSAPISAQTKAKYSFLQVPFNLSGAYFFKEPDHYKVKFEKAPEFLSKYPQVFGWTLPQPEKYTVKICDPGEGYPNCFMLRMVPVQGRGDLMKIEMWVDKSTWLFPRQRYCYRDGGYVDVKSTYRKVDSFTLFDTMHMDISFPKVSVTATSDVTYGEYQINKGLDDSIFEDKK